MENLIVYSIIFFIILIALIILYISLNPLEIKEKEKFSGFSIEQDTIINPVITSGAISNYEFRDVLNSSTEKCIVFKANTCQINFPQAFSNCEILVVGGGGGGSSRHGAGGGAGAVIYEKNVIINQGNYTINVGNGGNTGLFRHDSIGDNGRDSEIILNTTILFRAKGGGGARGWTNNNNGNDGGSGGGSTGFDENRNNGGNAVNTNIINSISGFIRGNRGGKNRNVTNTAEWSGGGGGGANENGQDSTNRAGINTNAGRGGNGIEILITGVSYYYGGGGGGGLSDGSIGIPGLGGLGGGGSGSKGDRTATNGTPNTGGGGGGGGYRVTPDGSGLGGNGGSGVVIIRYTPFVKKAASASGREQSTIANLNPPTEMNGILCEHQPPSFFENESDISGSENNYSQTATLAGSTDIYTFKFSSYGDSNKTKSPLSLFNYDPSITNNKGTFFKELRYNIETGKFKDDLPPVPFSFIKEGQIYNNTATTLPNGINRIKGEWVSIRFKRPFALVQYEFIANLAFESRAPGAWVIYGRNNNSGDELPYNLITEKTRRETWERYANLQISLIEYLPQNITVYNEYLFIFTHLAQSDLNRNWGHQLNFKEIKLQGRAVEEEL